MSRRHWLSAIALGLIVCGAASAQPQKQSNNQQVEQQAKPSETQQQKPIEPPPFVQEVPSTVSSQPDTAQSEPQKEDETEYKIWGDTPAQWVMAATAIFGLGLGVWTLILLARTLRATKDAGDYARRAAEATEATVNVTKEISAAQSRPYILYDSVKITTLTADRNFLELDISFRNCGLTPGIITATSSALYAPRGKEGWKGVQGSWRPIRVTIGPNQAEKIRFTGITADEGGNFSWFTIGILLCYESLAGTKFEEYAWLTFDGSGLRQDYPNQGFSLYRPNQE